MSAVDGQLDPADEQQLQAGRRDDDIGLELVTGLEADAGAGEGVDPVGDHRGTPVADRTEQVTVRHDAQPLVPRVVLRGEVRVDVVPRRQVTFEALAERSSGELRVPATELVGRLRRHRERPTDRRAGDP